MKMYSITVDDDGPSYFDARNPSIRVLTMNLVCGEEAAKSVVESLKAKYHHPMIVSVHEQITSSKEVKFA